jgi:predicted nucleic acid-binding protein
MLFKLDNRENSGYNRIKAVGDLQRIYFDSCCYFRPFDDLKQDQIRKEAQAKMFIQSLVSYGAYKLAYSFMSVIEIDDGYFETNKKHIMRFINENAETYVSEKNRKEVEAIALKIMETGIKSKDAIHIACAIISKSDYFLTTDKRVLKYRTEQIKILNPLNFALMRGVEI